MSHINATIEEDLHRALRWMAVDRDVRMSDLLQDLLYEAVIRHIEEKPKETPVFVVNIRVPRKKKVKH